MKYLLIVLSFSLLYCGKSLHYGPVCHSELRPGALDTVPTLGRYGAMSTYPLYSCVNSPDNVVVERDARVIYSVYIPRGRKHRKISYSAYGELTNDVGKQMEVDWYFVLSDSPTNVLGTEITRRKGYNISPEMHHGIVGESGVYVFPKEFHGYLNFVVYSASGELNYFNEMVKVETYGQMSVVNLH